MDRRGVDRFDWSAGPDGAGAPSKEVRATRRSKRRYRYHRRHTPHFYIVITGITAAFVVCVLSLTAYSMHNVPLSVAAFVAVVVASLIIFCAYFWGFYMLMGGHMPAHRIRVLLPHAAVGTLAPLAYTLNISLSVQSVGSEPLSGLTVICSIASFLLLCVQFAMGRLVVRPAPLQILRGNRGPR